MRNWNGSWLIRLMVRCLFGANPLPEPMLTYWQLDHWEQTAVNSFMEMHDDVIKWKHLPRYWPFVRGIHRSPVNATHKGQGRGALMSSLICAWINGWVNNCAHYDVTVMEILENIGSNMAAILSRLALCYREVVLHHEVWHTGDILSSSLINNSRHGHLSAIFLMKNPCRIHNIS